MVSIGTVLTLGIIGGAGILGYAVYRNADKVGGALARGVEENITAPIGSYFENLFAGLPTSTNGTAINPATIINPIPEAAAPEPGLETLIAPEEATAIEEKFAPKAQTRAKMILESFAPSSQDILIREATEIAKGSQTPVTTQAQTIVDKARISVGGEEPLRNKFYRLFTMQNVPAPGFGEKILPLSKQAVQYYAGKGIIAREVYL